jgi:hypothetical protein
MQCEGHLSGQHESLSADLTTPETAAAPRIADVVDLPGEPDDAARVDGRLWDVAAMCGIDAKQRRPRLLLSLLFEEFPCLLGRFENVRCGVPAEGLTQFHPEKC